MDDLYEELCTNRKLQKQITDVVNGNLHGIIIIGETEKKTSLLRRIKDFFARIILSDPTERGCLVWDNKLNSQLPEPVGATINDKPRIERFAELIKTLSFTDYYALKCLLSYYCARTKENFLQKNLSNDQQNFYRKWFQIYKEHLEVMD